MSETDRATLLRAAELLEQEAQSLELAYYEHEVADERADLLATAKALREMAK